MDHVQHGRPHDVTGVAAVLGRYLTLIKPGIVIGNLLSVAGGYLLGATSPVNPNHLLLALIGVGLVIAGACVFNNCIDRDIDAQMRRTRLRPLVTKTISLQGALIFGLSLTVTGFWVLLRVGQTVSIMTLLGFIVYVGLYSGWLKRRSHWATWVGSLAGAAPALAGFSVTGSVWSVEGLLLLCTFSIWQTPHSDAIALLHQDDYRAAGICALPISKNAEAGIRRIRRMTTLFALSSALLELTIHGYGVVLLTIGWVSGYWIYLSWFQGGRDERHWARDLMRTSLVAMLVMNLGLMIHF